MSSRPLDRQLYKYFLSIYVRQSVLAHGTESPAVCGVASFRVTICLGTHTYVHSSNLQAHTEGSVLQTAWNCEKSPVSIGTMFDASAPLNSQAPSLSPSSFHPCLSSYSLVRTCVGACTSTATHTLIHRHTQAYRHTAVLGYHVSCYPISVALVFYLCISAMCACVHVRVGTRDCLLLLLFTLLELTDSARLLGQ